MFLIIKSISKHSLWCVRSFSTYTLNIIPGCSASVLAIWLMFIAANQIYDFDLKRRKGGGCRKMSANEHHHEHLVDQSDVGYQVAVFQGGVGWLISLAGKYSVVIQGK